MDLITSYYPALADIPADKIAEVRGRLVQWYLAQGGEMDVRAGSVFGDHVLTGQAVLLAAAEIAASRLENDLTLAHVAEGIIYNCDVVENFLRNFGKCPKEGLQARGIVRLIFTSGAELTVDRRLRLQLGGEPGNVFRVRLFNPGNLILKPPGSSGSSAQNVFVFAQISRNLFAVDLPVIGTMTKQILVDDEALLDFLPPNLAQARALVDFQDGSPAASLPELAKRTCQTIYSASPVSRLGTQNFLQTELPDIRIASCLSPGDPELGRAAQNPLGVWGNVVDVCVTGRHVPFAETQEIELIYFPESGILVAEWNFPSPPLHIISLTCPSASPAFRDYEIDGDTVRIFTASKIPTKYPGLSCSYSMEERLWLVVSMPVVGEAAQIPLTIRGEGEDARLVATFKITYLSEPLVPPAEQALKSLEVASPLVDVLVKSALPVIVQNFTVVYTRRPGVAQNLDAAKAEIVEIFHTAGYPEAPTPYAVADAMFYNGAKEVRALLPNASLRWTLGTHALPADHIDPTVDPVGALMSSNDLTDVVSVGPLEDFQSLLDINIQDPSSGTEDALYYAGGPRNIRWIILADGISFSENTFPG